MADNNNNNSLSAEQQFTELIKIAKKATKVDHVGKIVTFTIYYGNNNVNVGLRPSLIRAIGIDAHLNSTDSRYYFLLQEEIFALVPISEVVKFRDEHDKHIGLPQSITNVLNSYTYEPYWKIAVDIRNLYTEYAKKTNQNKSICYMIYLDQLLLQTPKFIHDLTIHATCSKYTIEDNDVSGTANLLKDVLKRDDSQILHEMNSHIYFDANDNNKRNTYHRNHLYIADDANTIYRQSYLYKLLCKSSKPGQIYPSNFEGGASVFYISLSKEDPDDTMGLQWLMEHGYFNHNVQERLLFRFGSNKPMDIN